jgi:hypothetical protein
MMRIYKEATKLFVTRVTMVLIAIQQHKLYIYIYTKTDLLDCLLLTFCTLPEIYSTQAYIITLLFPPESVRPCMVYLPEHLKKVAWMSRIG